MNYDDFGTLRVRTYTAAGALPLEGALVKIYGSDEYNRDTIYSLITDEDGVTKEISLPAPRTMYSTSPGATEAPYSVYNAEISKYGFYPKRIDNIPIFNGISAVLPIEMIPLSYENDGSISEQNNLNSTIYENENL